MNGGGVHEMRPVMGLQAYLETLYSNGPAGLADEYTKADLMEDFQIGLTFLMLGLAVVISPLLDTVPKEHPFWTLVDNSYHRYVKCQQMIDIAGYTIRLCAKLGLELDPAVGYPE